LKKNHTMDLTSGSVVKKLLLFALPILGSNLLQQLYNTADMIVVGQFAGDNTLAAVGATGSITILILNLFLGLSTGANIICSNLYGERNKDGLSRCMHTSLLVAMICGVFLSVAGYFLSRPLLELTACPEKVIDQATLYMQIYFAGSPASMLYNFGSAILRAHGDTKRPMIILMISGLVNVGLNLLLVIVFHMDVAGVAIATVVSQLVSAVIVLWILFNPREEYGMRIQSLKIHGAELRKLISIGVPCGMNGIVFSFSNVILQSSVNSLGELVVAGAASSSKISDIVFMFLTSAYHACVSFAGQCYGAKKYKRIDELLVKSILLSSGTIACVAVLLTIFPEAALSLFSSNPEVISAAKPMLILFAWSYVLYAIPECTIGCIRGVGSSTVPTIMNAFCICVPRILWNYFFFPMNPTIGWLYVCFPISYAICSVAQLSYYHRCRKRMDAVICQEENRA